MSAEGVDVGAVVIKSIYAEGMKDAPQDVVVAVVEATAGQPMLLLDSGEPTVKEGLRFVRQMAPEELATHIKDNGIITPDVARGLKVGDRVVFSPCGRKERVAGEQSKGTYTISCIEPTDVPFKGSVVVTMKEIQRRGRFSIVWLRLARQRR